MAFIDQVKQWFRTGLYPTENQFAQTFEKLRFKDEQLAIDDVAGLQTVLNELASPVEKFVSVGSDLVYTIKEGYLLDQILIIPLANCQPSCKNEGGETGEIVGAKDVPFGIDVWKVAEQAFAAPKNIVIEGLPNGGTAVFITRKIL